MWATGIDQGVFIHELALRISGRWFTEWIHSWDRQNFALSGQEHRQKRGVRPGQISPGLTGHVVRSQVYTGIIVKWGKWWWHWKDFLLELYRDWYFDINELLMYTDNIGNGHGVTGLNLQMMGCLCGYISSYPQQFGRMWGDLTKIYNILREIDWGYCSVSDASWVQYEGLYFKDNGSAI